MSSPAAGPPSHHPDRIPKFRRGLVTARIGDALLIEGGPSRQLLTGAAASGVLPRLLPLLDGQHGREQICAELSLSAAQFHQATKVLDECGLLEWVWPGDAGVFAAGHVEAYFSRCVSITGSRHSAADLGCDLAAACVMVVAPPILAPLVAADLAETGVGTIATVPACEVADFLSGDTAPDAVAVFDDIGTPGSLDLLVTTFGGYGVVPILRCSATTHYAEVGPVFHGQDTACVGCFRRSQNKDDEDGAPSASSTDAAMTQVLASLMTSALFSILTGQAAPSLPRQLTRIALPGPVAESYEVLPDLDCVTCAGGTPPDDEESRNVLVCEWRVRKPLFSAERAAAHTPAQRALLASLQRQRDSFPGLPSHQLPDPRAPGVSATADRYPIDESAVAGILATTAGFRARTNASTGAMDNARWAPSGGNLGSVAIYLVTDRDFFGLPGTIFRYLDTEHGVVSIRRDGVALADFLEGTDLDATRTAIALALVGEAGRLSQKYDDFAWHLTHLDSGCAALQLHLVAASYGLTATFASSWPAQLGEMLELERRSEIVTAIASLSLGREAQREGNTACR